MICLVLLISNAIFLNKVISFPFTYITDPLIYVTSKGGANIKDSFSVLGEIGSLRQKYNDLVEDSFKLEQQNSMFQVLLEENTILKKQIDLGNSQWKSVEAEVMKGTSSSEADSLLINKGSNDGVKYGNLVYTDNTFIGLVSDVKPNSSVVRLPTSKASFLQVVIVGASIETLNQADIKIKLSDDKWVADQNKYGNGVATGSLDGIRIENIDNKAVVAQDNIVITKDEKVGEFMYLGKIDHVSEDPSASSKIAFVKVPYNLDELKFVFVKIDK